MPFQSSWPAEERATDQRRQRAARSGPGAAPTGRCAAALGPSATRISAERRWPWEKLLAGIPRSAPAWTNPAPLMSNFSSAAASSQGGRGSQPHAGPHRSLSHQRRPPGPTRLQVAFLLTEHQAGPLLCPNTSTPGAICSRAASAGLQTCIPALHQHRRDNTQAGQPQTAAVHNCL